MKFINPIVETLIVTDTPLCISQTDNKAPIKSDSNQKNSFENRTFSTMCQCPCTCQCPCPCQCMCVCPSTRSFPFSYNYLKVLPELTNIHFSNIFKFREEQFGGLLFNGNTWQIHKVNTTGSEVIKYINQYK